MSPKEYRKRDTCHLKKADRETHLAQRVQKEGFTQPKRADRGTHLNQVVQREGHILHTESRERDTSYIQKAERGTHLI